MNQPYAGKPAPPPELKAMSDKKPEVPMVEVTLTRPHTHAGVDYPAGAKITVREADRAWLAAHKVINVAAKPQDGAK